MRMTLSKHKQRFPSKNSIFGRCSV